jgi:hypothetical protein
MPTNANSYGPYDSGAGANITESFWRLITRWFGSTAVPRGYLNELNPFGDSSGLQAKVDTGAALIRGGYGEWTGITAQGLAAVGGIAGGSERWDRLVARNDFVNNLMQIDVLTGTAGASPNASRPALTQTTSMYEMLLGDVGPLINTTTTITAGMVIDGRWKMSEAGILYHEVVPGAVSSIRLPGAGTFLPFYKDIEIDYTVRSTVAALNTGMYFQANGDTAANYISHALLGSNSLATYTNPGAAGAQAGLIGLVPGASMTAGIVAHGTIKFTDFLQAAFPHVGRGESHFLDGANPTTSAVRNGSASWSSASAMTSIVIGLVAGNFTSSTFRVKLLP